MNIYICILPVHVSSFVLKAIFMSLYIKNIESSSAFTATDFITAITYICRIIITLIA